MLLDQVADMREASLAILPSLDLMANILTPSIREGPTKDTHDCAKVLTSFDIRLILHDLCLGKTRDGNGRLVVISVDQTGYR
jgi:hypothetical protein